MVSVAQAGRDGDERSKWSRWCEWEGRGRELSQGRRVPAAPTHLAGTCQYTVRMTDGHSGASAVLLPCLLAETITFHDSDGAGFRAARLGTQPARSF